MRHIPFSFQLIILPKWWCHGCCWYPWIIANHQFWISIMWLSDVSRPAHIFDWVGTYARTLSHAHIRAVIIKANWWYSSIWLTYTKQYFLAIFTSDLLEYLMCASGFLSSRCHTYACPFAHAEYVFITRKSIKAKLCCFCLEKKGLNCVKIEWIWQDNR